MLTLRFIWNELNSSFANFCVSFSLNIIKCNWLKVSEYTDCKIIGTKMYQAHTLQFYSRRGRSFHFPANCFHFECDWTTPCIPSSRLLLFTLLFPRELKYNYLLHTHVRYFWLDELQFIARINEFITTVLQIDTLLQFRNANASQRVTHLLFNFSKVVG